MVFGYKLHGPITLLTDIPRTWIKNHCEEEVITNRMVLEWVSEEVWSKSYERIKLVIKPLLLKRYAVVINSDKFRETNLSELIYVTR